MKYKDMTYTLRKDGRLTKKISINGIPKSLYASTPQELYRQYTELNYKREIGKSINKSDILFKDYAEEWFELNISNKEKATQNSVKNRIKHINQYIGNMRLSQIKPNNIQEIITSMQKDGYTDITNRTLMECKRILENAVLNDYIYKNPATPIKKIRYVKNERNPLSLEEDKEVIKLALDHKYGLFILIIRYCGLRPEEAVPLTIDDINMSKKTISVNKAVSLTQNQPQIKATKTLKNRTLPIPDILLKPLKVRLAYCNENGIKYIFTKEKDNYAMWTKTALKTHLNSFLNELNRNKEKKIKFSYYQLRHSYCTMLYYAGIGIKEAQKLMGHSSAKMVYDIYTHLDEERENSLDSINNYVQNFIINE